MAAWAYGPATKTADGDKTSEPYGQELPRLTTVCGTSVRGNTLENRKRETETDLIEEPEQCETGAKSQQENDRNQRQELMQERRDIGTRADKENDANRRQSR